MNISCHLHGFPELSLEQAIMTAARLGFLYIDIDSPHLDLDAIAQSPEKEAAVLIALLKEFHLTVADFSVTLLAVNSPEPEERDAALSQFIKLLPFIALLQPRGITIAAGSVYEDGQAPSLARSVPAMMQMVEAVSKFAPGVGLSLEYRPGLAASIAETLLLLECVPGLTLTLDTGNLAYAGLTQPDLVEMLPRTRHIHLRQGAKERRQVPLNSGVFDFSEWMTALLASGYRGDVAIEYLTGNSEFGAVAVNVIEETLKLRDIVRDTRARVSPS